MGWTKHVKLTEKYTGNAFNTMVRVLWGMSARLRGFTPLPTGGGGAVMLAPGAFIHRGIVVEVSSVGAQECPSGYPIQPSGTPPFYILATTGGPSDEPVIIYQTDSNGYTPGMPSGDALLAYSDTSGAVWTEATPLGIAELAAFKAPLQLTAEQIRLLTSGQDGLANDANTEHGHRGLMPKDQFERLTCLQYDVWPPTVRATGPVSADQDHLHNGMLTNAELDLLTARGGVQVADTMHLHGGLLTEEQRLTLTGGPTSDASGMHDHKDLKQAHGIVFNPAATIIYVPQNVGEGTAWIRGKNSSFQGSFKLLLGPSATGKPVDSVIGIRYKVGARFWQDLRSSTFGVCDAAAGFSSGTEVQEIQELFVGGNPSGIDSPRLFNAPFSWKGIDILVKTPASGRPFDTADYFVYNGVIRNTGSGAGAENGQPTVYKEAHERELSYAGVRYVGVLDPHCSEGGYWTIPYA